AELEVRDPGDAGRNLLRERLSHLPKAFGLGLHSCARRHSVALLVLVRPPRNAIGSSIFWTCAQNRCRIARRPLLSSREFQGFFRTEANVMREGVSLMKRVLALAGAGFVI